MDLKYKFSVLPPVITCHYTPYFSRGQSSKGYVTRPRLVVVYRRFGTAYLRWSSNQVFLESFPSKMGPKGCPEMSINQQPKSRNITEEQRRRLNLFITKSTCIK